MKKLCPTLLLVLITFSRSAMAFEFDVVSQKIYKFSNTDTCKKNKTCTLTEAKLKIEDYKIKIKNEESFGTRIFASYKTQKLTEVEDYAFVQFIRGCHFESHKSRGQVSYAPAITRKLFGKSVNYHFPNWVVDSVDTDPMYNSPPNAPTKVSRHALYQINENDKDNLYGFTELTKPELFVSDRPGVAFFNTPSQTAHNISLEFKMCLYRTHDIPKVSIFKKLNFAKPIACFEWASSQVYNHDTQKFENPKGIHEFCKSNTSWN